MLHGTHSVTIPCGASEVFGHIADAARHGEWRGSVVESVLVSGDGGAGSVWHQVVSGPGRLRADADYRVTACDPPRRYAFEIVAGPSRGDGAYELEEKGDGTTRVTLEVRLTPRGLLRVLNGFIPRQMSIELDSLDRLCTMLGG